MQTQQARGGESTKEENVRLPYAPSPCAEASERIMHSSARRLVLPSKKRHTVFWAMEPDKELLHVIVDKSHLIVAHQPIHSIANRIRRKS